MLRKSQKNKASQFSRLLKWIGYLTAILALITGLRETVKMISDNIEAHRKIDVLISEEEVQLQNRDYWSAWRSLDQASKINPESTKIHAAQERLAMAWLENISVSGDEKFSDITEKLEPVLTRGVLLSKAGPRRADLLAHIGWTYFLRRREGRFGLDPVGAYEKAVKEDETNPYAQAMWGHWIIWNGGKLSDARQHFASALASNRQRDYVRRLQLSALINCSDECAEEVVRVLTAMRKEQQSIDPRVRSNIFFLYHTSLLPQSAKTMSFINAVPPAEHVATFRWLFDNVEFDDSKSLVRSYCLARLQEAAGHRDEALASYRLIRSRVAGLGGTLFNAAEAGIKRLTSQ